MIKLNVKISITIILLFIVFSVGFYKIKKNEVISTTLLYIYQDFFVDSHTQHNLMLGSSTIKNIDHQRFLSCGPWLNRGIGNSTISAFKRYLSITSLDITPAKILLYAGENDLSRGGSIENTIHSYNELIQNLLAKYPKSDLHIIAIKPSPRRHDYWESFDIVNNSLEELPNELKNLYFHSYKNHEKGFGLSSFANDGVHLSGEGYRVFTADFNKGCDVN